MRFRLAAAVAALTLTLLVVAGCAGSAEAPAPTSALNATATTAEPTAEPTAVPPIEITPVGAPTSAAAASPTTAASTAASPTTSGAAAGPTVKVTTNPKLGTILTDATGMTLYHYAQDSANASNCYDQCAQAWPPLIVTGEPVAPPAFSGTLGTTTRRDGTKQVTYNQMPLYRYAKDTKPGDTNGQGIGGVWYAAQPNSP